MLAHSKNISHRGSSRDFVRLCKLQHGHFFLFFILYPPLIFHLILYYINTSQIHVINIFNWQIISPIRNYRLQNRSWEANNLITKSSPFMEPPNVFEQLQQSWPVFDSCLATLSTGMPALLMRFSWFSQWLQVNAGIIFLWGHHRFRTNTYQKSSFQLIHSFDIKRR
jgi:hypothetical protein